MNTSSLRSGMLLLLLLCCGSIPFLWAQSEADTSQQAGEAPKAGGEQKPDEESLLEWNTQRTGIQKTGMIVLGSWAVSNFAVSGYYMTRREDRQFYFHQMNVFWNVVNLAIAGIGYYGAVGSPLDLALMETALEYRKFSRILAINAALDIGYVMAGFYLKNRGEKSDQHRERLIGYGNSLILQGSFLFSFDVVLALVNRAALMQYIQAAGLEISAVPGGVRAVFSW